MRRKFTDIFSVGKANTLTSKLINHNFRRKISNLNFKLEYRKIDMYVEKVRRVKCTGTLEQLFRAICMNERKTFKRWNQEVKRKSNELR